MVKLARELNDDRPNCRFVVNDAPDLEQFESESFDFVYSSLVLQHMPSEENVENVRRRVPASSSSRRARGLPGSVAHPVRATASASAARVCVSAHPRSARAVPADANEAHAGPRARCSRSHDAAIHRAARRHGRARPGRTEIAPSANTSAACATSPGRASASDPRVSTTVVTVTYRAGPALLRCLDSLQGQEGLIETILVDNGRGGPEIDEARGREGRPRGRAGAEHRLRGG